MRVIHTIHYHTDSTLQAIGINLRSFYNSLYKIRTVESTHVFSQQKPFEITKIR